MDLAFSLFGDDLFCICFDHPNRETAMLSRVSYLSLLVACVENIDGTVQLLPDTMPVPFLGISTALRLALTQAILSLNMVVTILGFF